MDISPLMEKSFTDVYDEFLYACSHGDYLSVESLLEDGTISDSDISTTVGQQKFSPILTAIERNHLQVIKILLDHLPYGDFREALLLAIYLDLTKIAQLIMEHDTFKCFYGTFADWQTDTVKTFDESHFGGIRPIQLAAQYNRTTILYNFLKQGERIEIPHKTECQCNECKSAGLTDSLRHSQLRLSTYRGLSSDVYLALVSQDPFASAFDLSNELSNLIKNEPNFQTEYLFLFNQVSHFTGRLVDHIQNEIELELLITIERLNLAIEHDQQEFITHTTTQQHLTNIWYRNIDFTKSDTLKNPFLAAIYYILMYIPMYIGYFWFPFYFENRCQWYFQQPAIQALFHTILYQVFLLLLILSGMIKSPKISLKKEYPQIFEYSDRLFTIDEETLYYHRNLMTYLNISVLIFMLGFVCQSLRRIIKQRRCLKIMEMFMATLFVLYILLYTIAAIRVHLEWQSILDIDKWKRFEQLFNDNQSSNEYQQMKSEFENNFILFAPNMESVDIQMFADGILTITILCCIIYLCFFLLISEYLGPLLVSLIIMSKTIYRWFIFITIFIFAYQTSFLHLFSYYSDDKSYGRDENSTSETENSTVNRAKISLLFGNIQNVSLNVIFSLFGVGENELTQPYKSRHDKKDNPIHYYPLNSFTSTVGSLIYGSFAFCAKFILITMIIAYIKLLYYSNKQEAFNQWQFVRAKLYMVFINKDPDVLPVPLNLIPTPRHIMKWFRKKPSVRKFVRKNVSQQKKYLRNLNYASNEYNADRMPTTDDVMNSIVLRFLTKYHPFDMHSLKRQRQIQFKEELSEVRQYTLGEIQSIQQNNSALSQHISTVFFGLN